MPNPTSARPALIQEYREWVAEREVRKAAHAESEEQYRKAGRRSEETGRALFAADDKIDALREAMKVLDIPIPHIDATTTGSAEQ